MRLAATLALLSLAACASLPATPAKRTVVVDGEATIKVMPDTFLVSASLVTRSPDQSAGLAELSNKLVQVKESLPRLAGLKQLEINSNDIQLVPVYEPMCMRESGYGGNPSCPIAGRMGAIDLVVRGSPADRAGHVVSMLSQLGAETVKLQSFSLSNLKAEQDKAITAAVEDARAKASAIAMAAGSRVTGLEKVQYGRGFDESSSMDSFSIMSVWENAPQVGGLIAPTVDLDVTPSPVEVSVKIVASFAVE